MSLSNPISQSAIRGVYLAAVIASAAFFASLKDGDSVRSAAIEAGSAGTLVLAARMGEGVYDRRSTVQRAADAERYGR